MLAMLAMLCSPAAALVAIEKGPAAVPTGNVKATEKETVLDGDGKDAAVKSPTKMLVSRPRLRAVMAAAPKSPMVLPPR